MKRLIFCTGKIYYNLVEEREKRGLDDVAICTVRGWVYYLTCGDRWSIENLRDPFMDCPIRIL